MYALRLGVVVIFGQRRQERGHRGDVAIAERHSLKFRRSVSQQAGASQRERQVPADVGVHPQEHVAERRDGSVVRRGKRYLPGGRYERLASGLPVVVSGEIQVGEQGVEMVALCARNPTAVDTPKKREIRDKMFAEKFEAKSKAYLAECRRSSMIEYR